MRVRDWMLALFCNLLCGQFSQAQYALYPEKAFIKTDRSIYFTGETLWLSTFVQEALTCKPTSLSQWVYVELLSARSIPVFQTRLRLAEGMASTAIQLPPELESGTYTLVAYTRWMRNEGPKAYFYLPVRIVNALSPLVMQYRTDSSKSNPLTVRSIPALPISDKPASFSLLATESLSSDVVSGFVVGGLRDTVSKFTFKSSEVDIVRFTPKKGVTYTFTYNQGKKGINFYQFVPATEGVFMELSGQDSSGYTIELHNTTQAPILGTLGIVSMNRQVLLKQMELPSGKKSLTIPKKSVPKAPSFVRWTDTKNLYPNSIPLLGQTKESVSIDTMGQKLIFSKRQKVSFAVSFPQDLQLHVSVSLEDSMAVLAAQCTAQALQGLSSLPNLQSIYTDSVSIHTSRATANLKPGSEGAYPGIRWIPEIRNALLECTVYDSSMRDQVQNLELVASIPDSMPLTQFASINQEGRAFFELPSYSQTKEVVVQVFSKNNAKIRIQAQPIYEPKHKVPKWSAWSITESDRGWITRNLIELQANALYQKSLKINELSTGKLELFYHRAKYTYVLEDYTRFEQMEEVLSEITKGILLRKSGGHYKILTMDYESSKVINEAPLLLLDGIPLADVDSLLSINPLKIKQIEVCPWYLYQSKLVFGGLIHLRSNTYNFAEKDFPPHGLIMEWEGVPLHKSFEAPSYPDSLSRTSRKPDFRSTLYWNPSLKVKANSASQISFYTSDKAGKYKVHLTGIGQNGTVIDQKFYIWVK